MMVMSSIMIPIKAVPEALIQQKRMPVKDEGYPITTQRAHVPTCQHPSNRKKASKCQGRGQVTMNND